MFPLFLFIVIPSTKSKLPSYWGSLKEFNLSNPNNLIRGLSLVNIPSFILGLLNPTASSL